MDGTGPTGHGPLSGRGMGKCDGAEKGIYCRRHGGFGVRQRFFSSKFRKEYVTQTAGMSANNDKS